MFRALIEMGLNCLFPKVCCGCSWPGEYLCTVCHHDINFFILPLELKLESNYLDGLAVTGEYLPPLSQMIQTMKYKNVPDIAQFCAELMYFTTNFPQADYITAVPLHHDRLEERGYNQAKLIAQHLAKLTHIPYFSCLQKTKPTLPQASLKNKLHRLKNLEEVFVVSTQEIQQKSIIIIDDVVTTGTTLNLCAKVLKEAGAIKVFGLALAHGQQ